MQGTKHLISCNCILPHLKNRANPIFHSFPVFSTIGEDGEVIEKVAQCNNCGAIHKITEVGASQRVKKEDSPLVPDVDEIKASLPEKLVGLLVKYDLATPTWQQIKFNYDNEKWDRPVILYKEAQGEDLQGKYLLMAGKTLWAIESFSTEDV